MSYKQRKYLRLALSPEFLSEMKERSERIAGIMQACCSDGVNTADITKEGIIRLAILRGLDYGGCDGRREMKLIVYGVKGKTQLLVMNAEKPEKQACVLAEELGLEYMIAKMWNNGKWREVDVDVPGYIAEMLGA